jgi:hypothetical protein
MVVAVRIRPMSPKEVQGGAQKCCKVINGKYVVIAKAGIAGRYLRSQQGILRGKELPHVMEEKEEIHSQASPFPRPTPYPKLKRFFQRVRLRRGL